LSIFGGGTAAAPRVVAFSAVQTWSRAPWRTTWACQFNTRWCFGPASHSWL